jgi:hypothetical protein
LKAITYQNIWIVRILLINLLSKMLAYESVLPVTGKIYYRARLCAAKVIAGLFMD